MISILVAMLSVAAKDAFGVLSTIAMARGRALISGGLDVGYEAAFIFTAAFGAGPVIKNGLTPHTLAVIAAILATAFFTATLSTRYGNRMRSENDRPHVIADQLAGLAAPTAVLEAQARQMSSPGAGIPLRTHNVTTGSQEKRHVQARFGQRPR